ncbi:type IV conjugative transfer system protein TraL [Aquimonas sp.]|jgi:conjugal transfer pilus assembly protein TraL|uniref:type IV conjugative transfer system protein TraL n=1 Tax=Aquimonas sp. TaxID=1872588 RepID=UPI0037BF86D3
MNWNQEHELPLHLDDPQTLLFWSADELIPLALFLIAAIITEELIICMAAGVLAVYWYRRFKQTQPEGFLLHFAYWYGFVPSKARSVISPYIRQVLPL